MRHKVTTELRYPSLWRGCVGAWNPGLGPSGLTLRDWSGRGNHGTLVNSPTWQIKSGKYALQLPDGPDHVALGPRVPTGGDCTVIAWAGSDGAWTPTNFNAVLYTKGTLNGDSTSTVAIYWSSSLGWSFFIVNPSNTLYIVRSAFTPVAGVRYCIVGVCRGSQIELWMDGKLLNTAAATGGVKSSSHESYIAYEPVVGGGHNGFIGDIGVYNRALSPNEIRLLASRPGIAYELAPRRRSSVAVAASTSRRYGVFNPVVLRSSR